MISGSAQEIVYVTLQQDSLNPNEVAEAVRACFILTHRRFIQKRQPDMTEDKVDSITESLVNDVFKEENVTPGHTTVGEIKRAVDILEEQFNFASEPEIAEQHDKVIERLFELVD